MLNYCSVNMLFKLMYCNDIEASFLIAPNYYYFFFIQIYFLKRYILLLLLINTIAKENYKENYMFTFIFPIEIVEVDDFIGSELCA